MVVTGGDGDGFGIGGDHFIHTMRRNVDLLYVAMDNQIYGLTTGQTSPTSRKGMKTKSSRLNLFSIREAPWLIANCELRPCCTQFHYRVDVS